jgi:hypothetical protein
MIEGELRIHNSQIIMKDDFSWEKSKIIGFSEAMLKKSNSHCELRIVNCAIELNCEL